MFGTKRNPMRMTSFLQKRRRKFFKITVIGSPAEIISSLRRSYSRIQNHIPSTTINMFSFILSNLAAIN